MIITPGNPKFCLPTNGFDEKYLVCGKCGAQLKRNNPDWRYHLNMWLHYCEGPEVGGHLSVHQRIYEDSQG